MEMDRIDFSSVEFAIAGAYASVFLKSAAVMPARPERRGQWRKLVPASVSSAVIGRFPALNRRRLPVGRSVAGRSSGDRSISELALRFRPP
jgi:hypothetical protein